MKKKPIKGRLIFNFFSFLETPCIFCLTWIVVNNLYLQSQINPQTQAWIFYTAKEFFKTLIFSLDYSFNYKYIDPFFFP